MSVLVVDGTNLTHRAWHASQGNADADRVSAAVRAMTVTAARTAGTRHILIAFDGADASADRRNLWPEYKAGRASKPDGLRDALTRGPHIAASFGLTVVNPERREADDVLAHAAVHYPDTVLLTSDKDAYALLAQPGVRILRPGNPLTWIDGDFIRTKYGIDAARYGLWAALKGDPSDGIPGLPGIGEKTAAKIASVVGDVDEFLTDLETGGAKLRTVLTASRVASLANDLELVTGILRRNVTLMTAAPVGPLPELTAWTGMPELVA